MADPLDEVDDFFNSLAGPDRHNLGENRALMVHTHAGLEELADVLKAQMAAGHKTPQQSWQIFSHHAFQAIAFSPKRTKKELAIYARLALDFERWCGSHRRRS